MTLPALRFATAGLIVALLAASGCGITGNETDPPIASSGLPPPRPSYSGQYSLPLPASGRTLIAGGPDCATAGPTHYCRIQDGADALEPGDTLKIRTGVHSERVIVRRSGVPGNPILITSEGSGGTVIDGGCPSTPCRDTDLNDTSEPLEGLRIEDAHDVTVAGITVRNTPSYGIDISRSRSVAIGSVTATATALSGIAAHESRDTLIAGNFVYRSNLGQIVDGSFDAPEEAISIVNTEHFVVAQNVVGDTPKEGIDVKAGSAHGQVVENLVRRSCAVGIYINEADDIIVEKNEIRDMGQANLGAGLKKCVDLDIYGPHLNDDASGILLATGDLGDLNRGVISNIAIRANTVNTTTGSCIETWDELRGREAGRFTGVVINSNSLDNCGGAGIRLGVTAGVTLGENSIGATQSGSIVRESEN